MTKEHEITIRMPEYSPEIVWWTGAARKWGEGDPSPYKADYSKFPGRKSHAHATRDAVIKADEFWGDSVEPYTRPLEEAKEQARQRGCDWLLVFDIDMEVLDAYQL